MTIEGPRNLVEEAVLVVGMISDANVLFVGVTMNVRPRRMDQGLLELIGVNLEDARLSLIHPNHCVLQDDLLPCEVLCPALVSLPA